MQIQSDDRIAQASNMAFDAATFEIWGAWLNGAALVGIPKNILLSPHDFDSQLKDKSVTTLFLTTALFNQLASTIPQAFRQLKYLLFGGEMVDPKWVKVILQWGAPQNLLQVYGPTEGTTFSTWYQIRELSNDENIIPIGRPISNTQVYLLDSDLEPVPIGAIGELHIGGAGLALGYFNRPQLTQQKFIPNPFQQQKDNDAFPVLSGTSTPDSCGDFHDTKLYKTGDLARYLPDGNIEFVGRVDHQVKIRGYRVEIGEVELALNQHWLVKTVSVIVREDIPNGKQLVAYIVLNDCDRQQQSPATIPQQLRAFLKEKLPEYCIPGAFVILERLPLTLNGKIDRDALPTPSIAAYHRAADYIPAGTIIEEKLARIWAEVLKIEPIGIQDNFFDLGGHSLLATQVLSRIRETFNCELTLKQLFDSPTIAQLCLQIVAAHPKDKTLPLIAGITSQTKELPSLSFAQQRLWFLDQLESNNRAYHLPYFARLRGNLDVNALKKSFSEIVSRHEILRTSFPRIEGEPRQKIAPHFSLLIPIVDLQALTLAQQKEAVQEYMTQMSQESFDLSQDLLLRIKILRLQNDDHWLLLNIHHIIFDGWSFKVLFRELKELYKAFAANQCSSLTPLAIQYSDYSSWQRARLADEILTVQLAYWKKQLGHQLPVTQLPTDRLRPPIQSYQGASHRLSLSVALTEKLNILSQKSQVTLFMTLLAAFKLLLYRYSGQEDIVVGTPIAGRNHREIEEIIGFFVNSLVLRTDLSGNPSFNELLNRVRQVTLDAYAHQDLPFEKLVEELQPVRDLSHSPLFQIWFNMVDTTENSLELEGIEVENVPYLENTAKFDLSLFIQQKKSEVICEFVYNTCLFEASTIESLSIYWRQLLESIVTAPETSIASVSLLLGSQRQKLSGCRNLVDSQNNQFCEFAREEIHQSISARFQQQALKYPDNTAIKTENYHWTYRELNERVSTIANTLLTELGESEARIALFFEHDAPMVGAILGVLTAGKTYVPLDPTHPTDRILFILKDSEASLILTNNHNLAQAKALAENRFAIANIDQLDYSATRQLVQPKVSPDHIAYLLYTSGSTGQPKGVIQAHRNVLHFIRNYTNNLQIGPSDRLTLLSSYGFDASIMAIFGALLNGAAIYPFDIRNNSINTLMQWLNENKLTIYHSTPTIFRHFLKPLSINNGIVCDSIRLVVLGGEEVLDSDIDLYKQFFSDTCILINGLGPTESTVTLQYFINKQTKIQRHSVSVGYPVEETDILLLDSTGNQTDIWGEIAIRSPYVALGYWRRPELTQAAFFEDPDENHQRIYRTGDLGRLRPDGRLDFIGRKDNQVKIRGCRLELGEIETILCQHPAIAETVVIAQQDTCVEKRLVAYLVPRHSSSLTQGKELERELHEFLLKKLPSYMIPTVFVYLASLPLNPNGKVDRLALPKPQFVRHTPLEDVTTPLRQIELRLINIWQKTLKRTGIDRKDNFFALGGHSLLAVTLAAEFKTEFQLTIPLATFFQLPTLEEQANFISKQKSDATGLLADSSLVPIKSSNQQQTPLFAIHVLGKNLTFFRPLAQQLKSERPFYGLSLQLKEASSQPINQVEVLATHYLEEMQQLQPQGPYFLMGFSFGGMVAFEMAQQLIAQGQEVSQLILIDTYTLEAFSTLSIDQRLAKYWHNIQQEGLHYLFKRSKKVFQKYKRKLIRDVFLKFQEKTLLTHHDQQLPEDFHYQHFL